MRFMKVKSQDAEPIDVGVKMVSKTLIAPVDNATTYANALL